MDQFFNTLKHIQAIGNKLISIPTKPPTPDHSCDALKVPLRSEWYEPIFENYEKMAKFSTLSATFKHSLLSPGAKVLRPRLSFIFKIK